MLREGVIKRNHLWLAVLLPLVAWLIGCGGGGGSGSGTGLDPIEVEVGAVLDSFFQAIRDQNLDGAMSFVDSNLQYRRANDATPYQYAEFQGFLKTFLTGVASITISLNDRGISGYEDSASVRGKLVFSYFDSGNTEHQYAEDCEITMERVSKWGIRSFTAYNLGGLVFPPAP